MIEQIEPVRHGNSAHGDVPISLSEYGDQRNPGVILIHGIGNHLGGWLPVISTPANSFRVSSIDPRG